jgi:TorA maturation chaperone TorD
LHPSQLDTTRLFPDEEDISETYLGVFGHTISKECPPYEGEYYANSDITFRSQKLADVAGFYRAFGLDRRAKARGRIDFLSFEAVFMEILIARELYAAEEGLGEERIEVCLQAQRRFFIEHLGWWLPAFGVQLEAHTRSDYYRTLARFVRAFTAAERAVLEIAPFTELPSPLSFVKTPSTRGLLTSGALSGKTSGQCLISPSLLRQPCSVP